MTPVEVSKQLSKWIEKISTGGNISANNTGSSVKSNRRASLKRIITGGSNHNRKHSEENTKMWKIVILFLLP